MIIKQIHDKTAEKKAVKQALSNSNLKKSS